MDLANLPDVSEVVELTSWEKVNEYMKLGWKFLTEYTTCYDTEPPMVYHQTAHYCLCWLAEHGPVVHPKREADDLDFLFDT